MIEQSDNTKNDISPTKQVSRPFVDQKSSKGNFE